ncbi:MAG: methylmalonyl Co-A mutase-associated GTPase MeaB [Acidimicrobiales bacterium]|nr:MAG: methylmalonyl Co-A mutase-associated GTPase MeaB [Acidimicrobiales bacterium]
MSLKPFATPWPPPAEMGKPKRSIDELYAAARGGERRALGRLLSIVERGGQDADQISDLAHPDAGRAHIVGITGAPGAGKSTLVGQLVRDLVGAGKKPAVLAVDPSSPLTGGAILGDRIRMDDIVDPGVERTSAFIRSMATRGHSGGLALAVPLAVRLFDAAGYDPVIIETVGVGQVEVDVVGAADTAVVVMTPGMGDAVQANKAGLLEVADVFVVNKADRPGANDVRRDLDLMLDLSHMTGQESETGYRPPIVMASALNAEGSEEVWATVEKHRAHLDESGLRATRRQHRIRTEVRARLAQAMAAAAEATMDGDGATLLRQAEAADISPTQATNELLTHLLNKGPAS